MNTENENIVYNSCPCCGQEYTSSEKTGLCKLCLENAMEEEQYSHEDEDYPEDYMEYKR